MDRIFFFLGALMAGIAVAAGAYGAHPGSSLDGEQVRWIEKAARYQMYHGLALICVSLALSQSPDKCRLLQISGWLFFLGILFFSGSLYVLAFTEINPGYITPTGGVAFLAGWALMAVAGLMR